MVQDFRAQLVTDKVKVDEAAFTKDLDFVKAMIQFEIDNALFGVADARRRLVAADPQAQVALSEFDEARKLTELSRGASRPAQ